jgi:uncharacterized protein YjbI with pentapeptide repeats
MSDTDATNVTAAHTSAGDRQGAAQVTSNRSSAVATSNVVLAVVVWVVFCLLIREYEEYWPGLSAGQIAFIGITAAPLLLYALFELPRRHRSILVSQGVTEASKLAELEDKARSTLAQVAGGAFFFLTAFFTWQQIVTAREGQITDRFTKAIDQLGAKSSSDTDALPRRLGGILALERIANDSRRDHWAVMEVLTAYIRENAPSEPSKEPKPLRRDIEMILIVLGRRKQAFETEEQRLNLNGVDIGSVNLPGAHLNRALLEQSNLGGAHLQGASFERADMKDAMAPGAHFNGAPLAEAELSRANLEGADLGGAELQRAVIRGAYLIGTKFAGADLAGAKLAGANLWDADLRQSRNLAHADLTGAFYGEKTRWPAEFNPASRGAVRLHPGVDLRQCDLRAVNLSYMDLSKANMTAKDVMEADLSHAKLIGAELRYATLTDARLYDADLSHANLAGAELRGASFTGAVLSGTILRGARYNRETRWPSGFDPKTSGAVEVP